VVLRVEGRLDDLLGLVVGQRPALLNLDV
jgi:hypothetical protein